MNFDFIITISITTIVFIITTSIIFTVILYFPLLYDVKSLNNFLF